MTAKETPAARPRGTLPIRAPIPMPPANPPTTPFQASFSPRTVSAMHWGRAHPNCQHSGRTEPRPAVPARGRCGEMCCPEAHALPRARRAIGVDRAARNVGRGRYGTHLHACVQAAHRGESAGVRGHDTTDGGNSGGVLVVVHGGDVLPHRDDGTVNPPHDRTRDGRGGEPGHAPFVTDGAEIEVGNAGHGCEALFRSGELLWIVCSNLWGSNGAMRAKGSLL
mmetsp:Transcript_56122/g.177834  ORF Transcript_56122/g.177834 Transcript_56122/m.177834 type:complete len:223 (-) Transcript_56122:18-686(-)